MKDKVKKRQTAWKANCMKDISRERHAGKTFCTDAYCMKHIVYGIAWKTYCMTDKLHGGRIAWKTCCMKDVLHERRVTRKTCYMKVTDRFCMKEKHN